MRTDPRPSAKPGERPGGRSGARTGAVLAAVGMAVPEQIMTNATIADRLGVAEEWITRRTGTRERHVAGPGQRLDQFAAQAARDALAQAGVDPADVDVVLVGTTSAELTGPDRDLAEPGEPDAQPLDVPGGRVDRGQPAVLGDHE